MTGVELSEAERAELGPWNSRMLNQIVTEIVAARLAPVEAERNNALAVAKSMDHFAEVAERCEAKSNEYAAENRRLTALVEAGLGLADEWQAVYDRWANLHPAFAAVSAGDRFGIFRAHAIRLRDALGGAK